MELDQSMLDFIRTNRAAAMITTRTNGSAHVARITAGVVDGKVWVSGTQTRVRTRHVRANPQATLCVFADDGRWLGIEARITIHDGPDAPHKCLALRHATGHPPEDVDGFLRSMVEQQRLIYEFEPVRTYGRYQ